MRDDLQRELAVAAGVDRHLRHRVVEGPQQRRRFSGDVQGRAERVHRPSYRSGPLPTARKLAARADDGCGDHIDNRRVTSAPVTSAACPVCRAALGSFTAESLTCGSCGFHAARIDGVWRMLHPDRVAETERFLEGYLAVRHAEGRGNTDPAWHRALPSTPPGDPLAEQWRMRGVSWRHVQRTVLDPLAAAAGRGLDVVDLGAGIGWLSHRLRRSGHRPISIDVSADDVDGLRAASHLTPDWPLVQAHFDHLPLPAASVDVCIFNASLPYTTNLVSTLSEASRVLRPDGRIVVMDSPVYRHQIDGARMVHERHAEFERRFGTRSDAVASIGFLTPERLRAAGEAARLEWSSSTPWYGLRWAARPLVARLRRRRRPGRFVVFTAQRRSSSIMK